MKRYLLVGIATLFVSTNASLKEDFAKMDLDQERLLSDMRKSSALNGEDFDDDEDSKESEKIVSPQKNEQVSDVRKEENSNMLSVSEGKINEAVDSIPKKNVQELEISSSLKKLEMIKLKMKTIDTEFEKNKGRRLKAEIEEQEAMSKAEKEILAQRDAEKREVEAYEKQRAEKLAQESAKKVEIEKQRLAQKALDEKAAKEKLMRKKISLKEESLQQSSTEVLEEPRDVSIVDVNVTRELEEKTRAADEEYKNAILEMAQED